MVLNNYYVKITNSAEEELTEIYEYISIVLKSEISANKFVEKLEEKIERLSMFPYSCMEVITKPQNITYRKLPVKNYIVLYKIYENNKRVDIVHIYYSRRDYLLQKNS